jgi:hypothetical protein
MNDVPFAPPGTRPIDVWRTAARQWQPLPALATRPATQLHTDCALLELHWPASEREIKQAFRRRLAQVHPWHTPSGTEEHARRTEATREVLAAYKRLLARVRCATPASSS